VGLPWFRPMSPLNRPLCRPCSYGAALKIGLLLIVLLGALATEAVPKQTPVIVNQAADAVVNCLQGR